MVSVWRERDSFASPVVARWTSYPSREGEDELPELLQEVSSSSSISEALGDRSEPSAGANREFPDWLDDQEAGFFAQSAGESLPHEIAADSPRRDIFPAALTVAFFVMLVVGLGIYLWSNFGDELTADGVVTVDDSTAAPREAPPPPRPHIITPEDEAKVQTPFEAAADTASGTYAKESTAVLEVGAPVVRVLRDVEDLKPETAAPAVEEVVEPSPAAPPIVEPVEPSPAPTATVEPAVAQPTVPAVAQPEEPQSAPTAVVETAPPVAPEPSAAAAEDEGKDFAQLYAEGARLLQRERYRQALTKFEAALLQDPGEPSVYLSIGQIYFEYGNLDKALAYYRKAEALAPRQAKVHILMGLALHEAGRFDEARAHYQAYLTLAPDGPEAPAVRGILKTIPE